MLKEIKKHIVNLLHSYSTLLFIRNGFAGAILLAFSFLNPNMAVLGLFSWFVSFFFARFIGIDKAHMVHSIYTYNSILVGLCIGFLFTISLLTFLLLAGLSILTLLLSYATFSVFSYYFRLPVLNIPFTVVSTIFYLAAVRYSSLYVEALYVWDKYNIPALPVWLHGLLKSAGLLVFAPHDIGGLVVLITLLLFSRITFFLAVSSFFVGTFFLGLLKGSFLLACSEFAAFNFILTGIAIGGIFLIPAKRTFLLAYIGVVISVFIIDATSVVWSAYRIPVFTLPYNFTVLLFVYVLTQIRYPLINNNIQVSPEKSLLAYLNVYKRFNKSVPAPNLPFLGEWTVYQAFDGEWTHKGAWKYAYDFVIKDEKKKTFKNNGVELNDYYCFGKPIVSPIAGTVVKIMGSLPDNQPGAVNKENNWGNHIIIYSGFGYYVEISHLRQNSLKVREGDIVRTGVILASCGNSGYSPQPHIHMQVQYLPKLGAETVPFFFSNCRTVNRLLRKGENLYQNMKVQPLVYSGKTNNYLQFLLDDLFQYDFFIQGEKNGRLSIKTEMSAVGASYLRLEGSKDKLYFGIENSKFIFYSFEGRQKSPLKYVFAAMPRLPLTETAGLAWEEVLPDDIMSNAGPASSMLIKAFYHDLNTCRGQYKLLNNRITGEIYAGNKKIAETILDISNEKGFKYVSLKTEAGKVYELKRV